MYLLLFVLWLVLNGQVTFEIVCFGIGITAALGIVAYALFGYTPKKDLRYLMRLPLFLVYLPLLVWEILKANLAVIGLILHPSRPAVPSILVVDTGLKSRFAQFMMANSITLTPGTITVKTDGSVLTVHCLHPNMLEGVENGLLCRLLRRMEG